MREDYYLAVEWYPVNSPCISAIGFCGGSLFVDFLYEGKIHEYPGAAEHYKSMVILNGNGGSVIKYFNEHVRGKYLSKRLGD